MLNTLEYAGARIRAVYVSMAIFEDLFTQGKERPATTTTRGLPDGARLVAVTPEWQSGYVVFLYTHPSWDEVPAGAAIPCMDVVMVAYYPEPVETSAGV